MVVAEAITAAIMVAEIVSEIVQSIAESAAGDITPQQAACLEKVYESYVEDVLFMVSWNQDAWARAFGSIDKKEGKAYHSNAGSETAEHLEKAMKKCGITEKNIWLMKVSVFEIFGNDYSAGVYRKKLLQHEKLVELYSDNPFKNGGAGGGDNNNTAMLIAAGLILLLLLKGKK